ncbi:hypothetical protein HOI83_03285 [Candidatus Uhrbacteria bacterium]|jgi:hypothetical protein|nr:hypothetical protein [Candidatus Uhrbacteria bacterium]
MKIYVVHSSAFDYTNKLYAPLKDSPLAKVHELIFPHDGTTAVTNSKELIGSVDLVLAEVSFPSTGMGIELGWAEAQGTRILCIHKSDVKPSGSIKTVCKQIVSYDENDLVARVSESL